MVLRLVTATPGAMAEERTNQHSAPYSFAALASLLLAARRFLPLWGGSASGATPGKPPGPDQDQDHDQGREQQRTEDQPQQHAEEAAREAQAAKIAAKQEQLARDQQGFVRDVKIAAVALGILLVLTLEYTPMVVADYRLDDQYGDQMRSLVRVEGFVTSLEQVVEDGSAAWGQRVEKQVDEALREIDELDAYSYQLQHYQRPDARPVPPSFLTLCANGDSNTDVPGDPQVATWMAKSTTLQAEWREIVTRCIIEQMGAEFVQDGETQLMVELAAAGNQVRAAIAEARVELRPSMPAPSSTGSQPTSAETVTATVTPLEPLANEALDDIEASITSIARTVEIGPYEAVSPAPADWLDIFAGQDGSLRSFRDNLLLTNSNPFGPTSNREIRFTFQPLAVTVAGRQNLKKALDDVRNSQEVLQEDLAMRTNEIQAAVPDLLRPLLVVARPKYLVLGYPLIVTLAGAYLMVNFTRLQRSARQLGPDDDTVLPGILFVGIILVPLFVLLGLFYTYDWPQFASSWWRWAHIAPLGLLAVTILACAFYYPREPQKR